MAPGWQRRWSQAIRKRILEGIVWARRRYNKDATAASGKLRRNVDHGRIRGAAIRRWRALEVTTRNHECGITSWRRPCSSSVSTDRIVLRGMESSMSFSGVRALILIVVLVALVLGMSRFHLPGWIVPVGLLAMVGLLKGGQKRAS